MLSMRPITTHFNVMVLGTHHVGRIPFIKMAELPEASADKTAPRSLPPQAELNLQDQVWGSASPHAAFAEDPSAWATTMKPVMLPEACREIVYTVQVSDLMRPVITCPWQVSQSVGSVHLVAARLLILGACKGCATSISADFMIPDCYCATMTDGSTWSHGYRNDRTQAGALPRTTVGSTQMHRMQHALVSTCFNSW